ncbi:hypothetical protein F5Y05DRAFT_256738 [Hypoxylon sp. FL0543]|nr:hypothetical protein F5Y05DRAFT_256738 [Hypoxylon sp. FL0543]
MARRARSILKTLDVVWRISFTLVHVLCIGCLFVPSSIESIDEGVMLGTLLSFTGCILSVARAPWFCTPRAMCRFLCGVVAVVLFLTLLGIATIFSPGTTMSGKAVAWGDICYWIGFALEWKLGYCYRGFSQLATRAVKAKYMQQLP